MKKVTLFINGTNCLTKYLLMKKQRFMLLQKRLHSFLSERRRSILREQKNQGNDIFKSFMSAYNHSLVKLILWAISKFLEISLRLLWNWLNCLRMKNKTFIIHQILENIFCWFEVVPSPVKTFFANYFLFLIMKTVKVGMSQTFFNSISFVRIECQHFW